MKKLIATILLLALPAMAEFTVPELKNPVNDYANVLTRSGKEKIAREIVQLKKETGAQLGVLIVNSLDGDSLEDVSMRVAKQRKLGSSGRDDGSLLFIAVKDRKIRLEVGYGLESIVTDYKAKQITSSMKGALRNGDYDSAVLTAISGLSGQIKAHAQEITTKSVPTDSEGIGFGTALLIILGALGLIITGAQIRNNRLAKKREEENKKIARGFSVGRLTSEQLILARQMHKDLKKEMKNDPIVTKKAKSNHDDSFVTGVVAGSLLSSSSRSYYDSDSSSSDYSSSSSDWGGGGGDFGGGGSSDSF